MHAHIHTYIAAGELCICVYVRVCEWPEFLLNSLPQQLCVCVYIIMYVYVCYVGKLLRLRQHCMKAEQRTGAAGAGKGVGGGGGRRGGGGWSHLHGGLH